MARFVIGIFFCFLLSNWVKSQSNEILPGIEYLAFKEKIGERAPLNIHMVRIDLTFPEFILSPLLPHGKIAYLSPVLAIAKEHRAITAVNGSFFQLRKGEASPIGLLMVDKQLVYNSRHRRTALGITSNREILIGKPVVRMRVLLPKTETEIWINFFNKTR